MAWTRSGVRFSYAPLPPSTRLDGCLLRAARESLGVVGHLDATASQDG